MSFRKNLLKKIKINGLSNSVSCSIGTLRDYGKIDFKSMSNLLKYAGWFHTIKRGVELYLDGDEQSYQKVLVLDNDLSMYDTSIRDVLLRKVPTLKEMLNVKNIFKILNDKDVLICKKAETVEFIKDFCIKTLDLLFNESDLDELVVQGKSSLKSQNCGQVEESITLFSELLGFVLVPKVFRVNNYKIWGVINKQKNGQYVLGPMVIYCLLENSIFYLENIFHSNDNNRFNLLEEALSRKKNQFLVMNGAVFSLLKQKILSGLFSENM